jgi:phosphoglycolate phosphatase-like HAD superfamily hydrolase
MMPRAVIFDFDGVILESADIKTEAFLELFSDYPELRERILKHHLENQGISRYRKFEWIYTTLLGKELDSEESRRLGEDFSTIVLEKILACDYVPGARQMLESLDGRCMMFVASGTPQEELDRIVETRGLSRFFREVWGTPLGKSEIIRSILARYELEPEEVLFIGDGLSDYHAARETGVPFFARVVPAISSYWEELGVRGAADLQEVELNRELFISRACGSDI